MPSADSLKSPKLLLEDLNVLPDVCARTRDIRIPDLCRRGVGGGGIGRDEEAEVPGGDSKTGDTGVGDVFVRERDLDPKPKSILELDACMERPARGLSSC
jgi:hypothetical protein